MKPDQHKKKRSAQYKKKHGIPKNKSDSSSGEKRVAKNNSQQEESSLTPGTASASGERVARNQHSVHQDVKEVIPSFSRRKIESNWDRYEGLPDDDEDGPVTSRGVEFNRLLSETGHAEAQFRFKDEQNWDADQEHVSEVGSKFLSIDVEALARHIKAIPIPERLGIPRSLFEDDMLETFEKDAKSQSSDAKSCPSTKQGLSESTSKIDNLEERTQDTSLDKADNISANDDATNNKTTENLKESLSSINRTSNKKTLSHKKVESELCTEVEADGNDELDFLLSLENPVEVKGQSTVTCGDDVVEHVDEEIADAKKDIENEQTQSSKTDLETACEPDSSALKTARKPNATDELEDWLDDMLDD